MKTKLILSLFLYSIVAGNLKAQIVLPEMSPFSTVIQEIGFNDVRIEYSRPSVRGRMIFGDVVPYGKVWRVGANESTKIFVKETMTVEDKYTLPPGYYAIYAVPEKDEWTVIISKDAWLWGVTGYTPVFDAIRFKVKPHLLKEQVETLTIDFANVCSSCAEIQFSWDFTRVAFRISSNVDEKVMDNIKKFTTNPEGRMAGEYYVSAKYYFDTDRDLKQAMEWIDKALKYAPGSYWMTHTKAEIQAKMGDYKAAIETANQSIEEAKAMNDEDYVRINQQEIAKWKEIRKGKGGS